MFIGNPGQIMVIILENAVEREKDVQASDLDSVMKKCVVTYMDVAVRRPGYADNAGCNYLSPYW